MYDMYDMYNIMDDIINNCNNIYKQKIVIFKILSSGESK